MSAKDRRLGRGLDALLGDSKAPARGGGGAGPETLPIEDMAPGPFQPRRVFDDEQIQQLAESISEQGIVQPIVVRPSPDGAPPYQIIAGERRWRAAQRARLHEVPVLIRSLTDRSALELALVENIQREDLNPIEEADGYRRLIDEFSMTQEDLALRVGKSRSHVANMLRLLNLPEPVRAQVDSGALSAGHARALLTADDAEALARTVIKRGLSVRETERLVQKAKAPPRKPAKRAPSADVRALESDLTAALGLKVAIADKGESGEVRIAYSSLEQLDGLIRQLKGAPV